MLIGQWKYMSPIAALIGRCQMSRPRNFWRTAQDFRYRDPNIAQPVTPTDVLSTLSEFIKFNKIDDMKWTLFHPPVSLR